MLATASLYGGAVAIAGPAAAVTCSGYGCDFQNPYGAGCFSGSSIAEQVSMGYGIELRLHYSPSCRTTWASVEGLPNSNWHSDVYLHRPSNNYVSLCEAGSAPSNGPTSCYTSMLYDGGVTSYAMADVWAPSGSAWSDTTPSY